MLPYSPKKTKKRRRTTVDKVAPTVTDRRSNVHVRPRAQGTDGDSGAPQSTQKEVRNQRETQTKGISPCRAENSASVEHEIDRFRARFVVSYPLSV